MLKFLTAGLMLMPGVLACGPHEEAGHGYSTMGLGFSGGLFGFIIQILIIATLVLGISLFVKNLNMKGGKR